MQQTTCTGTCSICMCLQHVQYIYMYSHNLKSCFCIYFYQDINTPHHAFKLIMRIDNMLAAHQVYWYLYHPMLISQVTQVSPTDSRLTEIHVWTMSLSQVLLILAILENTVGESWEWSLRVSRFYDNFYSMRTNLLVFLLKHMRFNT